MNASAPASEIESELAQAFAFLDIEALRRAYKEQGRFLVLDDFLPGAVLERWTAELPRLMERVHRNYIPRHKKGGSVDYRQIRDVAPSIAETYQSTALRAGFSALVEEPLDLCPTRDLHACALYAYTEPGDHMGFHYDNSYYSGRRYTVLLGLKDRSSSKLVCRLHTRNPERPQETLEVKTLPGTLVLFDGDQVLHKVTALGEHESRCVVTMQYVTNGSMKPFWRFVSDMKDAIAYFGFRKVFRPGRGRS